MNRSPAKQSGLVTPGTGANFENHVLVVQGVLGNQQDLQFFLEAFLFRFQSLDLFGRHGFDLGVVIVEQIEAVVQFPIHLLELPIGIHHRRNLGVLANVFLVGLPVLNHFWIGQQPLQFLETVFHTF